MESDFDLSGRLALVTGSARNIGRVIALAFARHGADIAIHHHDAQPSADSLALEVRSLGRRAWVVEADLSRPGAGRDLAALVRNDFGSPDILVLNASVERRAALEDISAEASAEMFAVNFAASLELIQGTVPSMAARNWGRVLGIGSIQQLRPNPSSIPYAALKAAQANMLVNLAAQYAARGVTANTLAPGAIRTDKNAQFYSAPRNEDSVLAQIPARRLGSPEDCVGPALLLCSDAGSYINGMTIYCDGGRHIGH